MDPRSGPVQVPLNATAAQLLAKLAADLGTDDATGVLSRALGLLDLVLHAKRTGKRLCLLDADGHMTDVMP
ncbi:MAG TPA: hypothetical protein VKN99_24975 [Polyangia bacterium]|nr:hypothetical protein [Polyangia bacterium]